jgi:hypothetical protein
MIQSGIPKRVAMMTSGHKTSSVFASYKMASYSNLGLGAQRLDEHLKSLTGTKTSTIRQICKTSDS